MAVSTAPRPAATSVISWEKAQQQAKANKKNNPFLAVAIGAVVLLAVAGMWRLAHQEAPGKFVEVMTARRDVPAGVRLGITSITFLKVPKQYFTPGMITSLNEASGQVTRTYIPAGEPIQRSMLFANGGGLSSVLETHERAITLQLEDDSLVDHAIQPDDRVDVLCISASSNQSKKYTKTICQDIRVLMTSTKEQIFAKGLSSPTNKITLAVLPDQAELVNEAMDVGKVRLILRSRLSRVEQHLGGANPEDLLPADALTGLAPPPQVKLDTSAMLVPPPPPTSELTPPPPADPIQWMVEVIMGNKKETYGVPEK